MSHLFAFITLFVCMVFCVLLLIWGVVGVIPTFRPPASASPSSAVTPTAVASASAAVASTAVAPTATATAPSAARAPSVAGTDVLFLSLLQLPANECRVRHYIVVSRPTFVLSILETVLFIPLI